MKKEKIAKQTIYNHLKIEKKWQEIWKKNKVNKTSEKGDRPKCYVLDMFPYPSGDGLHVGHPRGYIATDVYSRLKKMQGFNVLHPMGWDAFGLPAEQYAIKMKINPEVAVKKNVKRFKEQISGIGLNYDWDREINTTDPKYYKWTQWIFLQLFKKGLAYESFAPINWCPSCKTGLANEDLQDGKCERCGTVIEKKPMRQWVLKIRNYADRLLDGLEELKWPEHIKELQRNWIGRSEGAKLWFNIANSDEKIWVFTTRPDTLYGVTYVVLAPENELVQKLKSQIINWKEVEEYIKTTKNKTEIERTTDTKEKTGVELKGVIVKHPITKEIIPVFISDYVLGHYGTGAVMAVPAHDDRDYAFAKKYNLPIKEVIIPKTIDHADPPRLDKKIVARRAIQAIVIDPKTKKVLCLRWKKFSWTTFVTGGVENDEDIVEAAKREIAEETGYVNYKYIKTLGGPVESNFFASHKDENRKAMFNALVFELIDDTRNEMSEEEKRIHDVVWLSWDEISKDINVKCSEYKIWLDRFFNPPHAYTEGGIMNNSGHFDGMENEEAMKAITEFAGGEMTKTYKLQDWVFSRQRYWGDPIPLIHCENCAQKPLVILAHGLAGNNQEIWFPWFKKTMEDRGYEVYIPNLSNSKRPKLNEWVRDLSKMKISKNRTVFLVGHSLGGATVCQYILKNKIKISKMILVAPTGPSMDAKNWSNIKNDGADDEQIKMIKSFNVESKKLSAIAKFVRESVVYLSDNDPYICQNVGNDYKNLKARTILLKGKGHFSKKAGIFEFSEILENFPVVETSGVVAVPEKDLPVKLPKVKSYEPTGTGESPLAVISKWVNVKCPVCGSVAKRETNTMPQWAGSCWYYLRYMDPKNNKSLVDPKKEKYWAPVDMYVGGAEHATRHLIYARFWHKFLFDIGVVSTSEPFRQLRNLGMVLGSDNRKMSKRWGNVVNPDDVIKNVGADTLRVYECFMGPFSQEIAWSTNSMVGSRRFLEKVWKLKDKVDEKYIDKEEVILLLNQTIKKVGEDAESFNLNTAVSSMMILCNFFESQEKVSKKTYLDFIKILSPFAPHICEEIWNNFDNHSTKLRAGNKLIVLEDWPKYSASKLASAKVKMVVQVNGKVRTMIEVPHDSLQETVEKEALKNEVVVKWIDNKQIIKKIFVKNKIINFVI